jgi:hypothetical protein
VRQGDSALLVDPHRHARLELGRGPNRIGVQEKVVDVAVSDRARRARCVAQDERFVEDSRNRAPSAQLDSSRNPQLHFSVGVLSGELPYVDEILARH